MPENKYIFYCNIVTGWTFQNILKITKQKINTISGERGVSKFQGQLLKTKKKIPVKSHFLQ